MRTFVAIINLCVLAVANVEAVHKETLNLTPLVDFTDVYNRHEDMQKLVDTNARDDSRNWTNSDRMNKGPNSGNQYNSGQQYSPGSPSKPSSPGVPGHSPSGNQHTPEKPILNFPSPISYPSPGNPNYPNNEYPNFQYPPGGYPNYPPGYPSPSGYPIYSPPGYPFYPPYPGYPPCYCQPKMQ